MKIYHFIIATSLAIPSFIFSPNAEAHKHFNKVKNISSSEKITDNGYEILKEKNYIHASEKLSEALEINPKNKFALLLRAFSKKELKDYKSALEDLNTILKIVIFAFNPEYVFDCSTLITSCPPNFISLTSFSSIFDGYIHIYKLIKYFNKRFENLSV